MNYKNSRNLAWQILIANNICGLPVKVSSICKSMNIPLISYKNGSEIIKKYNLERNCDDDGFTFANAIFYNDECYANRQRFTVAHELGHILLHSGHGLYNREPSANDNPEEHEANIFASRLLAPACVLWALNIHSADEISKICNISLMSAQFRMERLEKLYQREKEFLAKYNKSCFLQSPLERQVYENFRPYIQNYKSS